MAVKKKSSASKKSLSLSKSSLNGVLMHLLGRKLFSFIVILAIILSLIYHFFPGIWHIVRYYAYEGRDYLLDKVGFLPHYDNLDLGVPIGKNPDRIFNREGYAFGYSEKHEQPLWVIYKLTKNELDSKKVGRTNDFREDPRVLSRTALPEDYSHSGFDRGHLAPAADMGWNDDVMSESFYMSNMSPQKPEFNRGIWLDLEEQTRIFARSYDEIYVVSGPVFQNENTENIGSINKVAIPSAYYKVIFAIKPPRKMIGFILPNAKGEKNLKDYAVTVSAVEECTGLTFFPEMNPADANALKNTLTISDWNFQTPQKRHFKK